MTEKNEKLACLETLIGSNGVNTPGSIVSLKDLGIDVGEAEVLVSRGSAMWPEDRSGLSQEELDQARLKLPSTNGLNGEGDGNGNGLSGAEDRNLVLADMRNADGTLKDLTALKVPDLLGYAERLQIERASGMNKAQLISALTAEHEKPVTTPEDGNSPA